MRRPKSERDVARNGQVTCAKGPLDDGLAEDTNERNGHAPPKVSGARRCFEQLVRSAYARPHVSRNASRW